MRIKTFLSLTRRSLIQTSISKVLIFECLLVRAGHYVGGVGGGGMWSFIQLYQTSLNIIQKLFMSFSRLSYMTGSKFQFQTAGEWMVEER